MTQYKDENKDIDYIYTKIANPIEFGVKFGVGFLIMLPVIIAVALLVIYLIMIFFFGTLGALLL